MRNKIFTLLGIFILFVILSGVLFSQFFLKHLYPFPGNYMLAWFEPWKTTYTINGSITIAHKPVADDIFRQIYPFRILAMDMIKHKELPLWNPYNGAGMPLFATMNIGFLDPFNVFYFIFSNKLAWTYTIFFQPILIGYIMFLYCKKLFIRKQAAIFATIVYLFSGVVITRLIYGMFGLAFAMLPLSLYSIETFLENKRKNLLWILPIGIYCSIVSTQPQISCYILIYLAGYVLFSKLQHKITSKEMFFLFFLIILGVGLASIQLFPTFELMRLANVNQLSSQFIFSRFIVPVSHFITLFIPNYFGDIGTYNYWEPITDYIETVTYIGTIPLLFAWYALFTNKNKKSFRIFLVVVILFCFVTCLQGPFASLFFRIPIPILSTGIPTRIFFLSTFAISLLAGFGFDDFFAEKISLVSFSKKILPILLVIFSILIYTLFAKIIHVPCPLVQFPTCRSIALRNTLVEIIPFILLTCLLFFYLRTKKFAYFRFIIQIGTLLIVILLGLYNSQKYQPFSLSESFLPYNPLIHEIQTKTGIDRIFGFDSATIQTDFATLFRFYDPEYYHPLYIKRYGELVSFSNTGIYPPPLLRSDINISNNATISASNNQRRQRLFDLLGVKYFIYKKSDHAVYNHSIWENSNWIITQNMSVLPRAYFVSSVNVVSSNKNILTNLFDPSFDPSSTAIIEQKPTFTITTKNSNYHGRILFTHYSENQVTLSVYTNKSAFLVLSDNYYPGWQATIDGKKTTIYRTNYTFRGVNVSKGFHKVMFSYYPFSFFLGLFVSCISFIILVSLIIFTHKYKYLRLITVNDNLK